jgi:hypothetical protein
MVVGVRAPVLADLVPAWVAIGSTDRNRLIGSSKRRCLKGKIPMQTVRKQPTDQAARDVKGVMGAYYPTAIYCEKRVYEEQGWQGYLPK